MSQAFFFIGLTAYGMAMLQQEAVVSHHWLTLKEFADGIAFGQITPGPFLITATFIDYKVVGSWAAPWRRWGCSTPPSSTPSS